MDIDVGGAGYPGVSLNVAFLYKVFAVSALPTKSLQLRALQSAAELEIYTTKTIIANSSLVLLAVIIVLDQWLWCIRPLCALASWSS
jgi:hypothetical protein